MVFSATFAFFFPFELFLFAYAILGPLHYLTEISWLHDRKYFSHGKKDYLWLSFWAILACFPAFLGVKGWASEYDPVVIAFFSSLALLLVKKHSFRWILAIASIPLAKVFVESAKLPTLFAYFLPSLIHVFCFTWIFVLLGSLREKSVAGYAALSVMTVLAFFLLIWPAEAQSLTPWMQANLDIFGNVHQTLADIFGAPERATGCMRFIAFAYTYHYLNWFSKTRVIQWHEISQKRMATIIVFYLGFVGFYLYDYILGFKVILLLSLAHVLLEFPLNWKSAFSIASEIKERLPSKK